MALPKHKTSKSKRGMRRAHKRNEAPGLALCPQCGTKRLAHHACPSCGTYRGRQVTAGDEG